MSGNALLDRIDAYAQAIRERRPLTPDEVKELDAYFRIGMTYTSNALEGNSLTPLRPRCSWRTVSPWAASPSGTATRPPANARAYDYMLRPPGGGPLQFQEEDILHLHALFYGGVDPEHAGRYREGQVFITGTEYIPPTAEEVPGLMAGLVEDLNKRKDATHPVLLAAYAHRRLVDIHPFRDGNGRTARLYMILVNSRGYCVVSIPPILRHDYITALQQAQRAQGPSDAAFIKLICECELEAQKDYCRMFRIKLPER